jgi:hypothetical protein
LPPKNLIINGFPIVPSFPISLKYVNFHFFWIFCINIMKPLWCTPIHQGLCNNTVCNKGHLGLRNLNVTNKLPSLIDILLIYVTNMACAIAPNANKAWIIKPNCPKNILNFKLIHSEKITQI